MESRHLRDLTERVLNGIAQNHGFTSPRLKFSDAAKKNDNFVGQVYRFVVSDAAQCTDQLEVVVKLPPANKKRRKAMRVDDFFRSEVHMYSNVLPTLADYFKKKNLIPEDATFPSFARTYALVAEDQDQIVVMEDLKPQGFVMKDRLVGLDEDHCRLVLSQIARLHAASLALQQDNPKLHDRLTDNLKELLFHRDKISQSYQLAIEKFRNLIDDRFPVGSSIRNKVEIFFENYHSNMKRMVSRNSTLCCITHGDLWTNNVLFKYQKGLDSPQELCFVDLQLSRMATPIVDVAYFLALCPSEETRWLYLDLVKYYHQKLSSFLKDLGHDPEKIVPWDLLREELRKNGSYGWALAVVSLPMLFLEAQDVAVMDKTSTANHAHALHHLEKKNSDQIKNCFVQMLEQAEQLGFL